MLGHRELTAEDYADILKRRLWLILSCGLLSLGLGIGITHVVPPRYLSQTLVLIEQQKVPEDYVKPVVSEDLSQRLASMKEQILSRSRVEPIIEHFNLFAGPNRTMDDRVELMRKAITVSPIHSEQSRGGMPGFFISFTAKDPRIAQQVCGQITSLFVSENLNARELSAEGTTDFLKQQLANSKRDLDEQDAKVAAFQRKNIGKLPEQASSNASTLQALTTQLDAATQSLNRIQQNVTFLEAMISQQTHDAGGFERAAGVALDERRKELKNLVAQKAELDALYTPDHPDVLALARKISDKEAEIAHAPAESAREAASTGGADSAQLQQLKAQLRSAQQSMAAARQDQARIAQQVSAYEARIEASPLVEAEYKQITRDHETALHFYSALLTKMNESSMATALERRQQGEQFRVMDAPNLPDEPAFPKLFIFAGGGLGAGLAMGLLLVALLEYRDKSLRSERDVWAFTKLPTLAVFSRVKELAEEAAKGKEEPLLLPMMGAAGAGTARHV